MVTDTKIWNLNQTALLEIKNTMGGGNSFFFKVTSAEVCGFFEVSKSKRKVKRLCKITTYSPVPICMGWWNFSKSVKGVYIRPNPYKTLI